MKWALPNRQYRPTPDQAEALKRSRNRAGYGFFLEQGLGKTAVALAEYLDLLQQEMVDCMLVVCPAYLRSNWRIEAQKYGVKVPIFVSPDLPRGKPPWIWVTHYESIISSYGDSVEAMIDRHRYYMMADESTRIKNFNGKTFKQMLALGKECPYTRIGTGTPMPQNVMDLWSQLRFIKLLNGVNPYQFRNRFAVMGGWMGKQVMGIRNEEELKVLLDSHTYRAIKSEKDYPKAYAMAEFDMLPDQAKRYKEMDKELLTTVGDGVEVHVDLVITKLLKLQQIACGFIHDNEGNPIALMPPEKNPRLKALKDLLEDVHGKVIVFTIHRYSAAMLRQMFPDAAYMIGGMRQEDLTAQKVLFNDDPKCRLLIAQTSVGARGHTLIGQPGDDRCHTTIYWENNYEMEARSQSEDRNRRIGQDQPNQYWDMICSATDIKVCHALQRKESIMRALID